MATIKENGIVAMITAFLVALLIQGIQAGERKSFPASEIPQDSVRLAYSAESVQY